MGLTYIASVTASASATLSFTTGIDATYNEYQFHCVNMHPASSSQFAFQVNASGQSGFNEVVTTTFFDAAHNESDSSAAISYETASDQAQGTAYQYLSDTVGSGSDESCSGILTLYDPSSSVFVKHFVGRFNNYHGSDYAQDQYPAGYINVSTAIDEISFKFTSGNIDAGTIHMYGVG